MAYRYRSRRSARRLARKTRRNFAVTLLLIGLLIYATIQWILPTLITGLGFVTNILKPSHKKTQALSQNSSLAPPVLNIPYEATNTSQINISGYGIPNSKVAVFVDDQNWDTVDVSSDGSFEFKNVSLVFGTNNIYAKSIEDTLESLPSKLIKVIYDNEKPTLEIFEPEDNKNIQGGDKKIKIAGKSEPNVYVYINNSQIVLDKDGKFESVQPLNDGENNFTIKAQDLAGNFTEIIRRILFQP